jgi:ribose transport system permease protein
MNKLERIKISDFLMEYLVLIAIVLLVIVTAIVQPNFLTAQNFTNLMRQFGPLSFVALGMTFVILGGFIDLSVPGMISLVAMVTLSLIDVMGEAPALLTGLFLGTFLGCINGTVLVKAGASTQAKALFITFGMSQIYGALALLYTDGATMNRNFIAHPMPITLALGSGMIGFLSISFVLFLFCLALLYIFQKKTFLGRAINYTGGNITAAELGGLPTKRIMIIIYAICGLMAAISSITLFSRVPVVVPVLGTNFERDAIMAVVVGGTSLFGGKGSVLRTVLGVTLVVLMSNCMNLLGVQTHLQEVLRGTILVTAIWLDHRRHSKG